MMKKRGIAAVLAAITVLPMSGCSAVRWIADDAKYRAEQAVMRMKFEEMLNDADEALCYNDSTYFGDSLMKSQFYRNSVLVDYDNMLVGFLFNSAGDCYYEYHLKESTPVNGLVQARGELHEPGAELLTYYPDEDNPHRTCAVSIVMADGKTYSIENLTKRGTGYTMFLNLHKGMELGEEEKTWAEICGEDRPDTPYGKLHD